MRRRDRDPRWIDAWVLGLILAMPTPLPAQIAYVSLEPDSSLRLRQMNPDGTADQTMPLPFVTFLFPTWSRNGALLAITALDPSRPNERSQNVFSINTANGAIQQVTFFNDIADPARPVVQYAYPYYKAFSPDARLMAVSSFHQAGGVPNSTTATPILEVYSTAGGANPLQVHVDKGVNGKHHGGEGVDWSPIQPLIATPVQSSANFLSGGGPGETTAILLLEPVDGAVLQGRFHQLTFPRADGQAAGGDSYLWGEHDYQPKFSPNGRGVAYVRSFQNFFLLRNSAPDPNLQSLRIADSATGNDSEVIRLAQGFYVTSLDWSPDGTQLVFDLGQQARGPLGLQQRAQPETAEIYVVNVDGSGLRRVRGPGNATPAWRPVITPPSTPDARLPVVRRLANGSILLSGLGAPSSIHTIRASSDLSEPFRTLGSTTADATGNFQFEDTDAQRFSRRFYLVDGGQSRARQQR